MAVTTFNTDILTASYGRPIPLAYGRHLVAGNVFLRDQADPAMTPVFVGLGEGEWDGIEQLIINGLEQDLTLAGAAIHFHKGLAGQLSSADDLYPEGIGSVYPFDQDGDQRADIFTPPAVQGLTFPRLSYLALQVPFDPAAPSSEFQIAGIYRCRKVRTFDAGGVQNGYLWSQNPAWQIADLLTRVRGLSDARIHWASFVDAAAYCAAQIDPGNGVLVPRFESNVAFTEEVDFDTAMDALLATCRGYLLDTEGTIKLRIDQPRASVFDFQDHDTNGSLANIMEGSFEESVRDTRDTANRIELEFRDSENGHAVVYKLWNHEPQQARTGRVVGAKIQLGNMPQQQAERIGNYLLTRAIDRNRFVRLTATASSLKVMPGDVVRVKHDAATWCQGEAGATLYLKFEVIECTDNPDETRDFLLRAYDDSTYTDLAGPAQNLIGTDVKGRPPVPPAPPLWGLSANLAGELKLRAAVPLKTDWRVGDLRLLVDDEVERVSTTLTAPVAKEDDEITVASSVGFRVGDFVNFQREILRILGPGLPLAQPTSNTWQIGRAQKESFAWPAITGDLVTRLTWVDLHWTLAPRWTLENPTAINGVQDYANGPYYQKTFVIGRRRILYASLKFTGPGGTSPLAEAGYAEFASEPIVEGTLPGLRTSHGINATLNIWGPLAEGDNLVAPLWLPENVCIGLISADVESAPTGADIVVQMTLDGENLGPEITLSAGSPGSGVVFSGARTGNVGGKLLGLNVLQVGSEETGENLTLRVRL